MKKRQIPEEQLIQNAERYLLKKKAKLTKIKSGPCLDCGLSYPPYVMDLHHRDPATKTKAVSQCSIDEIDDEAAKCDLLCANCHRVRHNMDSYGIDHEAAYQAMLDDLARLRGERELREQLDHSAMRQARRVCQHREHLTSKSYLAIAPLAARRRYNEDMRSILQATVGPP